MELMGSSTKTIVSYAVRIKQLFSIYRSLKVEKIRGVCVIVEIDKSKFGKRKYHCGHKIEGGCVLSIVERTPLRRIISVPVPNRKKETLHAVIRMHVLPDSVIYTDFWRGYLGLSEIWPCPFKSQSFESF
jgi:hypothetical protein